MPVDGLACVQVHWIMTDTTDKVFAFHAPTTDMLAVTDVGYQVAIRFPKTLSVTAAWVRTEPDNETFMSQLTWAYEDASWNVWRGTLVLNTAEDMTLYTFKFMVDGVQYWLSEVGITPYFPERDLHYHLNPHYRPASWVWSQVFYQIFPERFFDGDPDNNVKTGDYLYEGNPVVAKAWGELPDRRQGAREFYGGDLEGIRQKLPYLEDLGITGLYLNPIFSSPSSHKYDTTDYLTVDPHFGGNESFALLCAALRMRGMRIVLDAVINHTSERHPWFDRYNETGGGAYHSATAATRDHYVFASDDPESYHGWYGVRTLPVLDYRSERLREVMYKGDDAVLRYWLRAPYSIDGWRFDVIHMLGEGQGARNNATFVRHFRETLREENPNAYVLGEHLFEATKWLQGDQEDAAMNYYGFTRPVTEFLAGVDFRRDRLEITAKEFDYMLTRARARIPFEIQLSQFNLLDSHDTPRFLTTVAGDKALLHIAVTLLFTYIGVPCIYYGDEIGMAGGEDPDCRRTFVWDEAVWDTELRAHYQALIRLRRDNQVLQQGAYLTLYAGGDAFVFARILAQDIIITAINRGAAVPLELAVWKVGLLAGSLKDVFNASSYPVENGMLRLELAEKSNLVLTY